MKIKILSISLLILISFSCGQEKEALNSSYIPANENSFEYLEVSGSYYEIGNQIGKQFKENIQTVIKNNSELLNRIVKAMEDPDKKDLSEKIMMETKAIFPDYIEELRGMADGANVKFNTLWYLNIRFELGISEPIHPGNSTVIYNDKDNRWLTQNIDEHKVYKDQLFLLKVTPETEISFYTLVFPGMMLGSGPAINEYGIAHTTNHVYTNSAQAGLPRSFIARAILESKTLDEAKKIALLNPRAYPWHHNIMSFDSREMISLETFPEGDYDLLHPEGLVLYTNQSVNEKAKSLNKLKDNAVLNSEKREATLKNVMKDINPENTNNKLKSPDTILERLTSHKNGDYAPCRHPGGSHDDRTIGTVLFNVNSKSMKVFKGYACKAIPDSNYSEYSFQDDN